MPWLQVTLPKPPHCPAALDKTTNFQGKFWVRRPCSCLGTTPPLRLLAAMEPRKPQRLRGMEQLHTKKIICRLDFRKMKLQMRRRRSMKIYWTKRKKMLMKEVGRDETMRKIRRMSSLTNSLLLWRTIYIFH